MAPLLPPELASGDAFSPALRGMQAGPATNAVPLPTGINEDRQMTAEPRPVTGGAVTSGNPHSAPPAAWPNGREALEDVILLLLLIAAVPAVILLLASPFMVLRYLASLVGPHL